MGRERQPSRRQQILEALAAELETRPGVRITTARLAEVLGVSEAALYRHFPSKARMFEGLIEFAEESVFGLARRILDEDEEAQTRCRKLVAMLLTFSARNPGITRILLGDALVGENERLRERVAQFFDRFETQLKQVLREDEARRPGKNRLPAAGAANLMLAAAEGRMSQFARSRFRRSPVDGWSGQWDVLAGAVFGA